MLCSLFSVDCCYCIFSSSSGNRSKYRNLLSRVIHSLNSLWRTTLLEQYILAFPYYIMSTAIEWMLPLMNFLDKTSPKKLIEPWWSAMYNYMYDLFFHALFSFVFHDMNISLLCVALSGARSKYSLHRFHTVASELLCHEVFTFRI